MHIPDRHQKTAIYYGRYSNAHRGKRKKAAMAGGVGEGAAGSGLKIVVEAETESPPSRSRANWARFIKKVYEADPLLCPSCAGPMRIIAFIEEGPVIFRILKHLGLLGLDPPERRERGPPTGTDGG